LDKIKSALQERPKSAIRVNRNSKLFKTIISSIKDKKGEGIVALDLKKIDEAVSDYFILCEAQSHVQIKAIADHIVDEVHINCDEKPFHVEYGEKWTLIDYVNIVVHVFQQEYRQFYGLETLWEDADKSEY
jgi:ribosome-associated protein